MTSRVLRHKNTLILTQRGIAAQSLWVTVMNKDILRLHCRKIHGLRTNLLAFDLVLF